MATFCAWSKACQVPVYSHKIRNGHGWIHCYNYYNYTPARELHALNTVSSTMVSWRDV